MRPRSIGSVARAPVLLLALVPLACASEVELAPAAEHLSVLVLGDGFVRSEQRRIPLELFVLELRQRVRAMAKEEVAGLRVHIDVDPEGGEPAMRGAEQLVDQLQVMGVRQVQLL